MQDASQFWDASLFMPHGHCYLWRPDILWLNVGSDFFIAAAYFSIPIALVVFVRRRPDIKFTRVFWMFASFILLCGLTHAMEILTTWHPFYGAQGILKFLTAVISIFTAVALWSLIPKLLALPSSAELESANARLATLTKQLEIQAERKTDELHQARLEMQRSDAKFRTMTDAMPQMVWSTLPNGHHDYFNMRWYEFTGVPLGSTDGEGWNGVFHAEDQARSWEVWNRSLATGEPYEIEYRLRHHSGVYRWILGRALAVRNENGEIIRWMGTCTDIDDQKRAAEILETKVQERTRELTSAYSELESFSYSVSHDLRAPLRGIDGFSNILLKRYSASLNAEAQGYLVRVKDAATRMNLLIEGMLQLSKIGRREMTRTKIDMTSVVSKILKDLKLNDPLRTVEIGIESDMRTFADPVLAESVFENLLANSWKFTKGNLAAKIQIGTTQVQDHSGQMRNCFYVEDNGVGFDMEFKSKLFGVFQRLHRNDEFEGTGIGLASVQRIVRRHGGFIDAFGEVGKGAKFVFTFEPVALEKGI